jgi:uncharacterized membrane protein YhaH (DUF805 family)
MDYAWFLFDFVGRISRAKFWLAILIIVGWMVFLGGLAVGSARLFGNAPSEFGFGVHDIFRMLDPGAYHSAFEVVRNGRPAVDYLIPLSFYAIGTPLFLWVYLATSIKRLHDRNKSGWWFVPFFIAPSLLDKLADCLENPVLAPLAGALAFGLGVWCFVELCCLRGTRAPNRFGPDPLTRRDTRSRWEQQSELEFLPLGAGRSPASHVKRGA